MFHRPVQLIQNIPSTGDPGAFGSVRKFDIHTGIDLYCENGTPVYAVEDGIIVDIQDFTGPDAGSPWWNATKAILVEGTSGVIVYGEIEISSMHESDIWCIGDNVSAGTCLAFVKKVLKKTKGITPTSMLHFELLKHGTKETYWWHHGQPQPENLLDPTDLINKIYAE